MVYNIKTLKFIPEIAIREDVGGNGVRKEWKHVWTRAEVHEKWI